MNLLNKLTRKSLLLNRRRTIVTIVGIMLSAALLTAVGTMFFCGRNSLIAYEKMTDGDYHIAFYSVPLSEAGAIAEMEEVEAVSVSVGIGYARIEESRNEDKPYAYIAAYNEEALKRLGIWLLEGRLPINSSEIVIPRHLITNGRVKNIHVGDTVTLSVGERVSDSYVLNQNNPYLYEEEELFQTQERTYTVVGIASRPHYSIEPYSAPGYTFITCLDQNSGNEAEEEDLYVRLKKEKLSGLFEFAARILEVDPSNYKAFVNGNAWEYEPEEIDRIRESVLAAKYNTFYNSYVVDFELHFFSSNTVRWLGEVCLAVILIILTTSAYCIRNSFDISITERIRQYGMLASIGATKKQIRKNVFYEAYILGAVGIPIGIFCGLFASYVLTQIGNYLVSGLIAERFRLIFGISWHALALAVFFGAVMIFFASLKSAVKASRIMPIQAIRSSSDVKLKKRNMKCPVWVGRIFGVGGVISYKSLKRSSRKYRTTVISIVVSMAVFLAISHLIHMLYREAEIEIGGKDYNLELYFYADGEEGTEELIRDIQDLSGYQRITVERTAGVHAYNLNYSDEYLKILDGQFDQDEMAAAGVSIRELAAQTYPAVLVTALGDQEFARFADIAGLNEGNRDGEAILLDRVLVNVYQTDGSYAVYQTKETDCRAGDLISIGFGADEKERKEHSDKEWEIRAGAVTDQAPFGIGPIYQTRLIVSDVKFNEMFGYQDGVFLNHIGVYVMMETDDSMAMQDRLEAIFESDDRYVNYHYYITNYDQEMKETQSLLLLFSIFLYGFITVVTLIGITSIFNTITTNMELRRQEFAMLKSIGMTGREFHRMVRLESVFLGTKALVYGVPAGVFLAWLLHVVMYRSIGEIVPVFVPPVRGILIVMAAVFVLIFCIMSYSMAKIRRQNTIETIRNENI